MIEADTLKDAARVADKAPNPTDILVTALGFRVVVRRQGMVRDLCISFEEADYCQVNPLVTAVRTLNQEPR